MHICLGDNRGIFETTDINTSKLLTKKIINVNSACDMSQHVPGNRPKQTDREVFHALTSLGLCSSVLPKGVPGYPDYADKTLLSPFCLIQGPLMIVSSKESAQDVKCLILIGPSIHSTAGLKICVWTGNASFWTLSACADQFMVCK